jgi:hypothetical protein
VGSSLNSFVSLAPFYWYVVEWAIWGNPITVQRRVTLCTKQLKWRMRDYENASKLFSLLRAIQLAKEGHSRIYHIIIYLWHKSGADPGYQVRGGVHLKKLRREEAGAKMFGVFRVKNHEFTPKNHIFPPNFRGGGARARCAPLGSTPVSYWHVIRNGVSSDLTCHEEEQKIQRPKEKGAQWQIMIYKTLHRKIKLQQHDPHYNRDEYISTREQVRELIFIRLK